MLAVLVILVVSGALIAGAALGVFGLSTRVEGFIVALAGGALIISAVLELIDPATEVVAVGYVVLAVLGGVGVFTVLDYLVKTRTSGDSGGGLLAAITIDGIPENLALGVALIGTGPLGAAALSGSILLSNLPEAAGGARSMARSGRSTASVLGLWTATAVLLSAAAVVGNVALAGVSDAVLALVRSFAGGAVVGSLAIEVFPKAFREDDYLSGPAVGLGLVLALVLDHLG